MELVKISQVKIGAENVNAVNARDLYNFLEVKTKFADWIKRRLDEAMADEHLDYEVLSNGLFLNFEKNTEGGGLFDNKAQRPKTEYALSIDLAKEIAMLERSSKGKEIRKYFIECEKQLAQQFKAPTNMVEALELALEQAKQIEAQKQTIAYQQEVIEYQGGKLNSYKEIEKVKRSKAEMATLINKYVRSLAESKFNRDYGKAYNHIYGLFAKRHLITSKINIAYLKKNNDHLAEVLEIVLAEID